MQEIGILSPSYCSVGHRCWSTIHKLSHIAGTNNYFACRYHIPLRTNLQGPHMYVSLCPTGLTRLSESTLRSGEACLRMFLQIKPWGRVVRREMARVAACWKTTSCAPSAGKQLRQDRAQKEYKKNSSQSGELEQWRSNISIQLYKSMVPKW